MEGMEYFYELFCGLPRGGPGDTRSTRKAFGYLKNLPPEPYILDIGCGHGMQTTELAKLSKGTIIALDTYQPFLDILLKNAIKDGVEKRIILKNQSMLEMDFENETFDVIWSEGALYFMGFQNGLKKCHEILKKNGYLVVTEAVFLQPSIPKPLQQFWAEVWEEGYPDIKDVTSNIARIWNEGFWLLDHFTLPKSSWIDAYYVPMQKSINELKKKYHDNATALRVFAACEKEIMIYNTYSDYFGYEFFIMQKR
ncbi:MAG: class I SAM-dependent methyltransferase [Euryarchaeota archaeon]|nr:class I SAM-dependent methyltransferase [Euryarchaeota archaeon]